MSNIYAGSKILINLVNDEGDIIEKRTGKFWSICAGPQIGNTDLKYNAITVDTGGEQFVIYTEGDEGLGIDAQGRVVVNCNLAIDINPDFGLI